MSLFDIDHLNLLVMLILAYFSYSQFTQQTLAIENEHEEDNDV